MGFQAYIVGSDQVWRPKYAFPDIRSFFLSFIKDEKVKRIAYAASFGSNENEYTEEQKHDCGILIEKFDAVSVRETSAIDLIKNVLQWKFKQLQQVADPTMLLDKTDYTDLIDKQFSTPANGLFYYILDMTSDKKKILTDISKKINATPFTVYPKSTLPESKAKDKIVPPPVEEWINAFDKAKFIITDSFHGCVFSILFNKPFIAYTNPKRGNARFHSLLKIFHLENRIISNSDEVTKEIINMHIEWSPINEIRDKLKSTSISFLQNALNQP